MRCWRKLKGKTPLHQALYRAYGMPFTKVSVLENVWLHDLQKAYKEGKLTPRPASAAAAPSEPRPPETARPAKPAAPKPARKPQPQKTQIKKLEIVPTNGYTGGF